MIEKLCFLCRNILLYPFCNGKFFLGRFFNFNLSTTRASIFLINSMNTYFYFSFRINFSIVSSPSQFVFVIDFFLYEKFRNRYMSKHVIVTKLCFSFFFFFFFLYLYLFIFLIFLTRVPHSFSPYDLHLCYCERQQIKYT